MSICFEGDIDLVFPLDVSTQDNHLEKSCMLKSPDETSFCLKKLFGEAALESHTPSIGIEQVEAQFSKELEAGTLLADGSADEDDDDIDDEQSAQDDDKNAEDVGMTEKGDHVVKCTPPPYGRFLV